MSSNNPEPFVTSKPPTSAAPYPWPLSGQGFTRDQLIAIAEYILASQGWIRIKIVMTVVDQLLVKAAEQCGTDTNASRCALLAARLMATYKLVVILETENSRKAPSSRSNCQDRVV
jgi:hypothetical protein